MTLFLIVVVIGCAAWLYRYEQREARARHLERVLRAARYRPERGEADELSER